MENVFTIASLSTEQLGQFRAIFGDETIRLSFFSDGTVGNYIRVHGLKRWCTNSESEFSEMVDRFNDESGANMEVVHFEDGYSDGDRWFPCSISFKIYKK